MMLVLALVAAFFTRPLPQEIVASRDVSVTRTSEGVATITARCACDWSTTGREAVMLELAIDGAYSQHVAVMRAEPTSYRVLLGSLAPGRHTVTLRRDEARSARAAGQLEITRIEIETFDDSRAELAWLSRAPVLVARPGTVERFSDFPLVSYVESDVAGEGAGPYRYQYTVIFSNEDGGTATDRLMATWGRTTDIEFVFGVTSAASPLPDAEVIQAAGHQWIRFDGAHAGAHPILFVATDNNMVASHGTDEPVRFAPAPALVHLDNASREAVMDAHPWIYTITAAEMIREGRVDPAARAGSGHIVDPARYAIVEACADVASAALAFDIGVREADGRVAWYSTDHEQSAFRIARSGCFRAATPVPPGTSASSVAGLRVRAYSRPASPTEDAARAHVELRRVTHISVPGADFEPIQTGWHWTGSLQVPLDGTAIDVR